MCHGRGSLIEHALLFFFYKTLANELLLRSFRLGVNLGVNSGMLAKRIVVIHEFTTSFLVQAGLWKGNDEQALDDLKDVLKRPLRWVPVSL